VNVTYGPPAAFQVASSLTYRPNYVGGDIYSPERSVQNYFNKAAFLAPSTATPNDASRPIGNLARNIAQTPGIFNFDLGLHKDFTLPRESMRFEFRSELNFSVPITLLSSITSRQNPMKSLARFLAIHSRRPAICDTG
jgi:hypothetical protein